MNMVKPFGLILFKKQQQDHKVLKDMLQLLKSHTPGKVQSFSYVEARTSLHPELSLWENLQLEAHTSSWKEFQKSLKPDQIALTNLIKNPHQKARESQLWEQFIVSFLKGISGESQNLLIDMDETDLSPFIIAQFKKILLTSSNNKSIYLASANSSLWLDCAHTIVGRTEYRFEVETFDAESIKRHWVA